MASSTNRAISSLALVNRLRFEVILCTIFGIMLPIAAFHWPDPLAALSQPSTFVSAIASTIASLAAIVALRKMSEYPGTPRASYALPTIAATYGIVAAALLIARVPYSSWILLLCFGMTLATRMFIAALGHRAGVGKIHVVPGGRVNAILAQGPFDYEMMAAPAPPEKRGAIVVADLHHDHSAEWERTLATCALNGIPVYHYKQVWEATTGKVQIDHLAENSFGALLPSLSYRKFKRLADLAVSLLLIPLLALPMLMVAVLIKLDSRGPALFWQQRMGYRGRPFYVAKFRTMRDRSGSHTENSSRDLAMTRADDDRITRIGRFLRRSRIDELPQIINILRGEMSWIGPRPEAMDLSAWYESELPFYSYRHIVRPGITGWAQINQGHVTELKAINAKLQYDFFYIKNYSYWIDTLIVFRTILVVLNGFGAR